MVLVSVNPARYIVHECSQYRIAIPATQTIGFLHYIEHMLV
jgi:hypothetical protein